MPRTRTTARLAAATLGASCVVLAAAATRSMRAQTDEWTPPHRMFLTPERALAIVLATDRKLDYVPGEVLVRFRPGGGVAGQQRALTALRSKPAAANFRWVGDVAVVTDRSELDATILAAQLASQPEIAVAEPNYLYRTSATPNDPGFSARQWNLTALDMPRAWDINPGGKATIIVAVVDTGITTVTQNMTFANWNGTAIVNQNMAFATNPDLASSRLVAPHDFVFLNAGTPV